MTDETERRQGRGRLSTLEMLPEEADADLVWLNEELRAAKRPQVAIFKEFNSRLADKGIGSISKGTFSRYSVKKATQWREYDERLRLSRALCESMGPDGADRMTVAISERLKMAADEILSRGNLTAKEIAALANANRAAITAQRHSAELRRSLETEFAERMKKVAKDVTEVARKAGVADQAMEEIHRALGVL